MFLVKWSKNLQNADDVKLLTVPKITGFPLCPASAISNLLQLTPRVRTFLLFYIILTRNRVPLTDARVRKHLSLILSRLGLADAGFTFH